MDQPPGLLAAFALDGHGGAVSLSWQELISEPTSTRPTWIHLDRTDSQVIYWLREQSGFNELTCEALLATDTRPRSTAMDEGELVILRGINLDTESEPEDMPALRCWFDGSSLISLRGRRLMLAPEMRAAFEKSRGPRNTGEVMAALAELLVEQMIPVVNDVEERIDALEDQTLASGSVQEIRAELGSIRRRAILLRRYIAPQREALGRLATDQHAELSSVARLRIRECADHVIRIVEDLESMRERAALIQEQLANSLAEQTNERMYILSIVAAVFLPLGFVTGLLGINVGGIPGTENPYAFAATLGGLVVIAALQVVALRWFKLF